MTEPNTDPTERQQPRPGRFQADMLTELFRDPLDPAYADAARARRERSGPLPGWNRGTRKVAKLVALLIIGVVLAVAYQQVIARAPARATARAALIKEMNQRQAKTDELAQQAEQLQNEVSRLRESALSDTTVAKLRQLEAATGMRKVAGDGVIVTMQDGPNAASVPEAGVLDVDLQVVANALWASGAEAIAINGRRLSSVTPIRTAGSAILVGNAHILGPYEVVAIGPPDLADRFDETAAAAYYRALRDDKNYAVGFDVKERDNLELPAAVLPQLLLASVPKPTPTPTPSTSPSGGRK
ncbi:DUF881 domain-containing protein [Catellatospora tritici]|uniref:DUF881 domain-containing protein n=1 Tax=Catellatospora tritici TaxID=2851566 RepID=UPI001C2D3911|nr:DUF881 domain-containing protein [Catellatospora tritici]MBV1852992.1 DUF881 domain-containing protein [Catellatospora tritici]